MKTATNFVRRIGTCPKCMHEAFLAAAASWSVCLVAGLAGPSLDAVFPLIATAVVAGLLTLLWFVHLTVFAARVVIQYSQRERARWRRADRTQPASPPGGLAQICLGFRWRRGGDQLCPAAGLCPAAVVCLRRRLLWGHSMLPRHPSHAQSL